MIKRFFEPGRAVFRGGMGAVAPMERSAAEVELVACVAAGRVTFDGSANTSLARHEQHALQRAPGGYVQEIGAGQ